MNGFGYTDRNNTGFSRPIQIWDSRPLDDAEDRDAIRRLYQARGIEPNEAAVDEQMAMLHPPGARQIFVACPTDQHGGWHGTWRPGQHAGSDQAHLAAAFDELTQAGCDCWQMLAEWSALRARLLGGAA